MKPRHCLIISSVVAQSNQQKKKGNARRAVIIWGNCSFNKNSTHNVQQRHLNICYDCKKPLTARRHFLNVIRLCTKRTLYQFHYINKNKTWTEAQQYCREKHTDLATVTNMKDMKRLNNISAGYQSEAWIGLISKPFKPNDGGNQGSENCVIVNKNLSWIDNSCQTPNHFICYNGEINLFMNYFYMCFVKTR
uniref:C-type lectin domain-containing protein n=1 Tax=Xiphophorus maculatus TaxID=8083 RepID=A0A3B5R3L3_XIPMA